MFKEYKGIFKDLQKMQDQLWRQSMASFPGLQSSTEMGQQQQETLRSVNRLVEQAVAHSLALQREWLEQWEARVSGNKLKPDLFAELSGEAMKTTQRWLDNQNRLWNQWLDVLRASGGFNQLSSFEDWEKAVQRSLEQQLDLMNQWSDMAAFEKLSVKEANKLSKQMTEAMEKSIEMQGRLWSQWLDGLAAAGMQGEAPAREGSRPGARATAGTKRAAGVSAKGQAPASGDDLKQIAGIGPGLEKKLKAHGISTLRQLAELGDEDIAKLEQQVIRFPGRIKRDRWVEQAKELIS